MFAKGPPRRPGQWLWVLVLPEMIVGCGLFSRVAKTPLAHTVPIVMSSTTPSATPSNTKSSSPFSPTPSSVPSESPLSSSPVSSFPTTSIPVPSATHPGLVSMFPMSGPHGTVVTFVGVGLGTSPGRVVFLSSLQTQGGTALAIRGWTETRIQAIVPYPLATGVYTPELWTAAGIPVGPTSDVAWPLFTVSGPAPSVTGLSPAMAMAGSLITITGDNFGSKSGRVSLCQFCGTASQIDGTATIVVWTPTEIQARVPGMQNGVAEIHLTTAAGQVVLAGTIETGGASSSPGGAASG